MYQPIVNMVTNEVISFEALARWDHKVRGRIAPADFIPIAESRNLICMLNHQVFKKTLSDMRELNRFGCACAPVSVNISAATLDDRELVRHITDALEAYEVDPSLIWLELTETMALADGSYAHENLFLISEAGIRLALDDFGTGYSSLGLIKDLPISRIKIDRSFVTHIASNEKDRGIVESIGLLAKALQLELVAEDIETRAQVDFLSELGIEIGQGFFYSKPISARQIRDGGYIDISPPKKESLALP